MVPPLNEEELWKICAGIVDKKTIGFDGISNRALKLGVNTQYDEGILPAQLKK